MPRHSGRKAGTRRHEASPAARFNAHVMRAAEAFDAATFGSELPMRPGKMRVSLVDVLNDWTSRMSVNRHADPKTRTALAAAAVRTLATLLHGVSTGLSSIQLAAIANLKPVTIVQAARYNGPASRYAVRVKDFLSVVVTMNGRVQEFAKMMAEFPACAATMTTLSDSVKASVGELKRRLAMMQVQTKRSAQAARRLSMLERRGMVAHKQAPKAEEEQEDGSTDGKKEVEEAPVLPPAPATPEGKWADEVASAPAPAPEAGVKAPATSGRRRLRRKRKGRKPSMRVVERITAHAPKAAGAGAGHAGHAVAGGAA